MATLRIIKSFMVSKQKLTKIIEYISHNKSPTEGKNKSQAVILQCSLTQVIMEKPFQPALHFCSEEYCLFRLPLFPSPSSSLSFQKLHIPPAIRPPPLAAGIPSGCHVMYVGHGVLFGAETKEKKQAQASREKKGNVRIRSGERRGSRLHYTG